MSDIAVKKLAEMVNAPVEVLLKQLQDAGIYVNGPDAWITDKQKLTLLAHIRQSSTTSNTTANANNNITLKRRSTSEMTVGAGRGKTVSVEVRRKKTFSTGSGQQSASDETTRTPSSSSGRDAAPSGSRTEELARQLANERKAREAAIQKAEQERRQLEARRMEQQRLRAETAANKTAAGSSSLPATPVPVELEKTILDTPVAEPKTVVELSPAEAPSVENVAVETETTFTAEHSEVQDTTAKTLTVEQEPAQEEILPAIEPVPTPMESAPIEPIAMVESAVEKKAVRPKETSHSTTTSVTPPLSVVVEPEPLSAKEQRQAVAAAAKEEAAAALKRRPSKLKAKPVVAPPPVVETKQPEAAKPVVQTQPVAPAPVAPVVQSAEVAPAPDTPESSPTTKPKPAEAARNSREREEEDYKGSERQADKKTLKKPTKNKANLVERDDGPMGGVNRHAKKKGSGKQSAKADPRQAIAAKHGFEKPTAPVVKEVEIPTNIIVSDLAQKLAIRATDIIKAMMKMGMMVTINQSIDQDTAILVTEELGHKAKPMQEMDDAALLASIMSQDEDYKLETRPPVVTIMGHVDHGKTSLLDYIRKTRVAAGEAGGITQHIGAYHVDTDHGTVTFLDTPGHAAFTKMRARGAQVTDIVVLIVAADDGVMPQTKEAIQHAKAAGVPMVVAINKIDKPTADPDRVLSELSQNDVQTEAWGGDVPIVRVSAKTGQGIDELLETILLVAEVQELKASVDAPAAGNVIEASIEKGRGAVATILVRSGTLRRGDLILCGSEYGRVRAMFDEAGRPVKEAGPSIPVAVLGLSAAPEAGDEVVVLNDERKAKEIAELRREKQRDSRFAAQSSAKLDNLFSQMQAGTKAQVNLLVKADVQGSVEAIRSELLKLTTDEVEVRIVSSGVGGINGSDVDLAAASKAIMVAFNVRADASARKAASDEGIEIRYYSIIYDVVNDVKEAMSGLLSPEVREVFVGLAEVRNVFRASGFGQVAGCLVIDGAVRRGLPIRVLRDNVVIFNGELESLRRHRDDVKEVQMGTECGIAVKDYNDVRVGDNIECYERIEVARKI